MSEIKQDSCVRFITELEGNVSVPGCAKKIKNYLVGHKVPFVLRSANQPSTPLSWLPSNFHLCLIYLVGSTDGKSLCPSTPQRSCSQYFCKSHICTKYRWRLVGNRAQLSRRDTTIIYNRAFPHLDILHWLTRCLGLTRDTVHVATFVVAAGNIIKTHLKGDFMAKQVFFKKKNPQKPQKWHCCS